MLASDARCLIEYLVERVSGAPNERHTITQLQAEVEHLRTNNEHLRNRMNEGVLAVNAMQAIKRYMRLTNND